MKAPMIALIDYGAGNLTSVRKALAAAGAQVWTPAAPRELAAAGGVIVPGVGNFEATAALDEAWRDAILTHVESGRPLLGICLGMQWLFEGSEEAPGTPGLGLMKGRCTRLAPLEGAGPEREAVVHAPTSRTHIKVPHVGWNVVRRAGAARLLAGLADGTHMYFTHSYAAPITPDCVATTAHGVSFASVVERGLICGVQFHPEKSGAAGLRILGNFVASVDGEPADTDTTG